MQFIESNTQISNQSNSGNTLTKWEKSIEIVKIVVLAALAALATTLALATFFGGVTFFSLVIVEILSAPTPMTPVAVSLCILGIIGSGTVSKHLLKITVILVECIRHNRLFQQSE